MAHMIKSIHGYRIIDKVRLYHENLLLNTADMVGSFSLSKKTFFKRKNYYLAGKKLLINRKKGLNSGKMVAGLMVWRI